MKKILLILLVFVCFKSSAQSGYTTISARYNWLAGIFKALGVPSGDAASFTTGQAVRAGAIFYDSTGADSGLYVYSGLSWQRAGSSLDTTSLSNRIDLRLLISDTSAMLLPYLYDANEGLSVSGKYAQLGGITTSPAMLSSNRRIDYNDKMIWFTDGSFTADSSLYYYRYTPFNNVVFHEITASDPGYDVLPKSGSNFNRIIRYTAPGYRAQNRYGQQVTLTFQAQDSAIIRTDGGDYNTNKSELTFLSTPGYTGRTVYNLGHGTLATTRSQEGPAAHLANVNINDPNLGGGSNDHMYMRGHTAGYRSYLLMGGVTADTLENHIYFSTGSFIQSVKHINKSYVLKPDVWWNQVDSAFLIFDTARAATSGIHTRAFWRAKTKIGGDVGWVSPYQFAVGGSTFIEDSLVHGLRLAVTDTTGVDIMVRDRATGILKYITADDLGVGGGGATPALQQVFDQEAGGSLLTKNDTILNDYTLNVIGNSSVAFSPLLSVNNSSTTGGGIVARSAGTNSSFYGVNTKTSSGGGSAFVGESQGSNATAVLTRDSSSTNTTVPVLQLIRSTSGSAANDIGASISFGVETTSGVTEEVAGYGVKLSNATSATKETQIDITGKDNSVTETFMNIQKDLVRINNNADTLATLADVRAGGGGGSTAWGGITGNLPDQTDLQTALDAKLAHTTANPAITTTTPSGTGVTPTSMFAIERTDFTGQNITTVQPVFSTGQDVWTLQGSTTYEIEGLYYLNHGATSHSVGLSFELGGGASLTSISYFAVAQVIAVGIISSAQTSILVQTETNAPITAAGAVPNQIISFKGYITMNAGGTVTPSYTFSAAPGGTVLTKAGSYIKFTPVGTNVISKVGNVN